MIRLVITFVDTSSTDKSQIKKNQVIPSKIIVYSEHQKEKKNNTKKTKTKTKKQNKNKTKQSKTKEKNKNKEHSGFYL